MHKTILFLSLLFIVIAEVTAQKDSSKITKVCFTENEMILYKLVMQYRKTLGLPEIPLSSSLSYVAQTHVKDLAIYHPDKSGCNLHSWSNNGKWSSCCYTPDHKQANSMWNKPRELTNYKGNGYEIAFNVWHSDDANYIVTAEEALKGWKESKGHNEVVTNKGIWKTTQWNAIGIGIYKGYAVIWFGAEKDAEPMPVVCK